MLTILQLHQVTRCANLRTLKWMLLEGANEGDAVYFVVEVMEQIADLVREQYANVNRRQLTVDTMVIWSTLSTRAR